MPLIGFIRLNIIYLAHFDESSAFHGINNQSISSSVSYSRLRLPNLFRSIPAWTNHRRSKLVTGKDQKCFWGQTKNSGNYECTKVLPCSTVYSRTLQIFLAAWHIASHISDQFWITVFRNRLRNSIKSEYFLKRKVWAIAIVVIKKPAKQKILNALSFFWRVGTLRDIFPDRFMQITDQNWQMDWLASCISPEPTCG